MTTRKPPRLSFPDWIEHQIRTAEAAGAFDNLPGTGKPIPDIDRPQHELAWVAGYLRRQNVDIGGLLPPALALAKEVEELPVRLLPVRTEVEARELIADLNARIDQAWAAPQDTGPPVRVKNVDEDAAVADWRATRDELTARREAAAAQRAAEAEPPAPRRRLRLRRRADVS